MTEEGSREPPEIGDQVRFDKDGIWYRGTIMDLRPHLNDPSVRFAFVAVLGSPRMFPVPFQRQGDGTWKPSHLEAFATEEAVNVL